MIVLIGEKRRERDAGFYAVDCVAVIWVWEIETGTAVDGDAEVDLWVGRRGYDPSFAAGDHQTAPDES